MRPIFCGNFEYDARQSDLERLFGRYGKVDRVDMKSGFAFVYMDDERDAEDAIRGLDRTEFGRRRLRVEWTKHERGIRRPGGSRRSSANLKPTKTLFVINFDPVRTRTRDLERHFDQYGKISNIRIRRNFAFIQFESQEDATKALDATNMSKLMDRIISVEYAARDDDDRRNGSSPDRRGRDRSPERRSRDRGRSPSPYRKERASPDYGHGASPYSKTEQRGSPKYQKERGSPDYGHGASPYSKTEPRGSPNYRKERASPDYGRGSSPYSKTEPRGSPNNRKERASPDYGRGSSPYSKTEPRGSPNYRKETTGSSPDYGRGSSPYSKTERRGSPRYDRAESPVYERDNSPSRSRSRSRSPSPQEKS